MNETAETVAQHIAPILRLEEEANSRRPPANRIADGIAGFVGSVAFVVLHLVWFGLWAAINTRLVSIVPPFDPYPFQLLAMIVSLEGVLLATFVLIKQNRMSELSDRRAHMDLQINLLTEREVTRLLQMTERLAEHLGIEQDTLAGPDLSRETQIENMVHALDEKLNEGD